MHLKLSRRLAIALAALALALGALSVSAPPDARIAGSRGDHNPGDHR